MIDTHESTDRKLLKTYLFGNEEAAETTVCDRRTGFSTKKKTLQNRKDNSHIPRLM